VKERKNRFAFLSIGLGCWLIASVHTFTYCCAPLFISDFISGGLLIVLGLLSLAPGRVWSGWAIGVVGVWLQCAPLFLWAKLPLFYLNDTLIGALAIVFSFALAKKSEESDLAAYPKGWSYNPSSWDQRIPTVFLGMLCWFFARYMAAYQLGYIPAVWDPFFGDGTLRVITSDVSKAFPVSDAGLGALSYTLETLLGWQGGVRRFATMPWLVFFFAFLVIPGGMISILLIILQPIAVGAWCSWCLATVLFMLVMILFTASEVVASWQILVESKRRGKSLWRVFWKGSNLTEEHPVKPFIKRKRASGITVAWNLIACGLLGAVLMLLPAVVDVPSSLSESDYIAGPIIITLSVIAMTEVLRALRYGLILLGGWLILAPWAISSASMWISFYHLIIGALLFLFALHKGAIKERYGIWERYIV
jgi:hypothetical protein